MAVMTDSRSFEIVQSEGSLGRNLPQRLGRALWLPMLLMAVMAFAAGFVVAIIRANEVADDGAIEDIEAMRHVVASPRCSSVSPRFSRRNR